MKKMLTIICMMISLTSLMSDTVSGQNLVSNSGFESATPLWNLENWANNTVVTERTTDTAHNGSYCQRVRLTSVATGSQAGVYLSSQPLAVKPGTPLLCKIWIRGKDFASVEAHSPVARNAFGNEIRLFRVIVKLLPNASSNFDKSVFRRQVNRYPWDNLNVNAY